MAHMSKIGIQMYTVRDFIKDRAGLEGTLKKLADIGYKNVQISVPPFMTVKELAAMLAGYGLKADSVFCTALKIVESAGQLAEDAAILKTDVLRTDSIPAAYRKSADGYLEFAAMMNKQAAALKAVGLKYMYHFHAFEFVSFGKRRGIDIMLEETDKDTVLFQPDVFWLTSAGTEPSVSLKMFAGRAEYIHVKDYMIKQLDGVIENVPFYFAAVGTGNLNWPGIMKTTREMGIKQYVVEQDKCDGDVFEAAKTSYVNLVKIGAGT